PAQSGGPFNEEIALGISFSLRPGGFGLRRRYGAPAQGTAAARGQLGRLLPRDRWRRGAARRHLQRSDGIRWSSNQFWLRRLFLLDQQDRRRPRRICRLQYAGSQLRLRRRGGHQLGGREGDRDL